MNVRSLAGSTLTVAALLAGVLASSAAPAAAQGRVSLGAGLGTAKHAGLEIAGPNAFAAVRLASVFGANGAWISLEAFAQRATGDGSPLACRQVDPAFCLGRSDEAWVLSGAASLELPIDDNGGIDAYLVPVGIGAYWRSMESTEHEGPTGACVVDGEIVGCPDDPSLAAFSEDEVGFGPGISAGGGLRTDLFGVEAFAEIRAHLIYYGDEITRAAPIVVGVTF